MKLFKDLKDKNDFKELKVILNELEKRGRKKAISGRRSRNPDQQIFRTKLHESRYVHWGHAARKQTDYMGPTLLEPGH